MAAIPVRFLLAVLLLLLLLPEAGCTGAQLELVPQPLPGDITVSGKWDSNWGRLEFIQLGQQLSGTSDYNDCRLEGVVEGDLILFDWEQPGDPSEARQGVSGKGWFRISQDGQMLDGGWGYGKERAGGGSWHAERVR
ncbi:MAG: hypothetical protein FJ125_17875 [Deltaproteobacteria bacterium]|nr:hypothetical protein [Deltaproteobacteria bacterium]